MRLREEGEPVLQRHPVASAWLDASLAWPSLLYAEVAHVTLRLCRTGRISSERARDGLDFVDALPAEVCPVETLVRDAWEVARARGLSVYDACYAVLAEQLDVPLVTADRRLAAAVRNAIVISA